MEKGLQIKLAIVPVLLIVIGVFSSLYLHLHTITPSAAGRYERIIATVNGSEDCKDDNCIATLLKRSAVVDIYQEEALIYLSAALKDLSIVFVILGVIQLFILFTIDKRKSRSHERKL